MKEEVHTHANYEDLSDVSVFRSEPKGAGLCYGQILKKPQHEFTLEREQHRYDTTLRQIALKTRERGVRPTAALLSANRVSSQFVGVPAMERTIIGNVLYLVSLLGHGQSYLRPLGGNQLLVCEQIVRS